jgi:hypothetical protein
MSRRAWFVILVIGAVAALLLSRALGGRPSDEDRIRAMLHDAARAAEEKRVGDAVQGLSERFEGHGLDKLGAKQLVAFHVLRGTWVSVTLAGEKVEVQGDRARAVVDVVMSRSGKGKPLAELLPETVTVHRFDLRLAREADGWKVTTAAWRRVSLEEAAAGPELAP